MKGFAMLSLGKVGWIEKDEPECGYLDALVSPIALSPCTSDIHTVYEGAIGDRKDMILGHEAVGKVVRVGEGVKDFKPGDKVIVPAITPDWLSIEAQGGYSMHSGGMLAGWKFSNYVDGVFSEVFKVSQADGNLAHLPESVDPISAVMLSDMIPTGLHGAELAKITFGESVCVIGIGPVGLMSVAGAKLHGASHIYAVGSRPKCIEIAKQYGATEIINYKNGSIEEQIDKLTHGRGVDKVIIAGGDADTFATAVRILKPGGIIGNVNYLGNGKTIDIPRTEWGCGMGHKTISGGLMPGGRLRMERLVSLIETKRLDPSPMLTHVFNGFDHLPEALELMRNKPADLIKPVVII